MGIRRGSISTPIIADGLVFNMDPANRASTIPSTSTTICKDTINTSRTGNFESGTSFNPNYNGVYSFDGSDDYINITTLSDLPVGASTRTMGVWFRCTNTDNSERSMISYGTSSTGRIYTIYLTNTTYGTNGQLRFGGWSTDITFDTANLKDSNWHYAVIAYNGTGLLVWLDGEVVTNGTWSAGGAGGADTTPFDCSLNTAAGGTPSYFWIGRRWGRFSGDIGNSHLYNRVLSTNEVLHNYNALKGRFGL